MIKIKNTRSTYAYDEDFDGYQLQSAICEINIEEDGEEKYVTCAWKAEAPEYMSFYTTKYSLWNLLTFEEDDIDELTNTIKTVEALVSIKNAKASHYALLYNKAFHEVRKLIQLKGFYRIEYEEAWYEND